MSRTTITQMADRVSGLMAERLKIKGTLEEQVKRARRQLPREVFAAALDRPLAGGEVGDVELGDDVDTVDLVAGEDRGGLGGTGGQDQAGDEGQHAHGKGSESGWKVRVLRDGDVPGYDSCES